MRVTLPKRDGWFKRRQRRKADRLTRAELLKNGGEESSDIAANAEEYKQRYAQSVSKVVGLQVKPNSDYVNHVIEVAEESSQQQLNKTEEKNFMGRLNEGQVVQYKAQVFADHFLRGYARDTTESDKYLPASSSEQPGYFQKARRFLVDDEHVPEGKGIWGGLKRKVKKAIVNTGGAKFVNKALRVFEATTHTGSYNLGFKDWLYRNIPFVHDGWKNIIRDVKMMPWLLSVGYLSNYYIWQVKYDYLVWAFFIALGFTGTMMMEFNNRIMFNLGRKPMEGVASKAIYSFWHSWLTYPVFIPTALAVPSLREWGGDLSRFLGNAWDKGVVQPVDKVLQPITSTETYQSIKGAAVEFGQQTCDAVLKLTGGG